MNWSLALRYALRDLRGGIKGFRVFLACLALGVAAIAGVGSLADAIVDGLRREGRAILGGDMEFRLVQRPASVDELNFMKSLGTISQVVELRAMARALAGDGRTIVELKAVDRAYPMVGQVVLSDGRSLADALALVDGKFGIVAEQALVERLNLKPGDLVRLGSLDTVFRATLVGDRKIVV
jgi:putative ABC transport system permease protein